jgi:hypothetical protein
MALFVAAGIGVLQQQGWWRTAAVIAAIISLPVTVLFLGGTAAPNKLAATVVDIVILVGVLWLHWPAPEMIGS